MLLHSNNFVSITFIIQRIFFFYIYHWRIKPRSIVAVSCYMQLCKCIQKLSVIFKIKFWNIDNSRRKQASKISFKIAIIIIGTLAYLDNNYDIPGKKKTQSQRIIFIPDKSTTSKKIFIGIVTLLRLVISDAWKFQYSIHGGRRTHTHTHLSTTLLYKCGHYRDMLLMPRAYRLYARNDVSQCRPY